MADFQVKIFNAYSRLLLCEDTNLTYKNFSKIDLDGNLKGVLPDNSGLSFRFRKYGVYIQPFGNIDCQINKSLIQGKSVACILSENDPATLWIGGQVFAIMLISKKSIKKFPELLGENDHKF